MSTLGPANVLQEKDIVRLIASMSSTSRIQTRNRALVVLLWRTGLRISEALNLRRGDLFLAQDPPFLRVLDSKTQAGRRTVGAHRDVLDTLESWLAISPSSSYVFCTLKATKLDSGYVRAMLAHKGRQLGIARIHPHAFRATLAVELVREGVPLPAVRDVLGHHDLSSTDAYLKRVFPEMAIKAVIDR